MLEHIPSYKKRLYPFEDIVHLLLFPDLQKSGFVCSEVLTSIHQSVSVVVNLGQLDSHKDELADDMGLWKCNGVDNVLVSVTFTEEHVQMVRRLTTHPLRQVDRYNIVISVCTVCVVY